MEPDVLRGCYAFILEGKQTSTLSVDEEDLIENADGELDCPLEGVLRKNKLSLSDLNEMKTTKLSFVKIEGEEMIVLRTVPLNVNI